MSLYDTRSLGWASAGRGGSGVILLARSRIGAENPGVHCITFSFGGVACIDRCSDVLALVFNVGLFGLQTEFTKMMAGFFGGEGFVLQRLTGKGDAFVKARYGGLIVSAISCQ